MKNLIAKLEKKYNSIVYLSTKSDDDVALEPVMSEKPYTDNKKVQSILKSN